MLNGRQAAPVVVGIISDTHGLLRAEAVELLRGSDAIIHAGDIGPRLILEALSQLAPVTVVRGNVDRDSWTDSIPETASMVVGGLSLLVVHDLKLLSFDPAASGYRVVISGHSHKPDAVWKDGVLYLNPGSAGPRRFSLPISLARLHLERDGPRPELLTIDAG